MCCGLSAWNSSKHKLFGQRLWKSESDEKLCLISNCAQEIASDLGSSGEKLKWLNSVPSQVAFIGISIESSGRNCRGSVGTFWGIWDDISGRDCLQHGTWLRIKREWNFAGFSNCPQMTWMASGASPATVGTALLLSWCWDFKDSLRKHLTSTFTAQGSQSAVVGWELERSSGHPYRLRPWNFWKLRQWSLEMTPIGQTGAAARHFCCFYFNMPQSTGFDVGLSTFLKKIRTY